MEWSELAVREVGEDWEEREDYFSEQNQQSKDTTRSKLLQINKSDLYLIGGSSRYPSLLARYY